MLIHLSLVRKINILIVLFSCLAILFSPYKKNIWYDESISIIASKGITYDSKISFDTLCKISSIDIKRLNNFRNVFNATVMDNDNSFLYNVGLHYFTLCFGNKLDTYILFSRFFGICALVGIFLLCNLLFKDSLSIGLGVLFLLTDFTFWGMSNEIRAYSMGVFFVILATIYLIKYLDRNFKSKHLLLFVLSSIAALLVHFFCVYIIFVLAVWLLIKAKLKIWNSRNIIILSLPFIILGLFFYCAHNQAIDNRLHTYVLGHKNEDNFDIKGVLQHFMKFSAINYRIIIPKISDTFFNALLSFTVILLFVFYGNSVLKKQNIERTKYNVFFVLGIVSSFFFAIMSFRLQRYSPFYYRYFVFGIPFSSLFLAYFMEIFSSKNKKFVNILLCIIIFVPATFLLISSMVKTKSEIYYNHDKIAQKIINENIYKIEVPDWDDAFLIQSFMPNNYSVDYILRKDSKNIILHSSSGTKEFPLIRNDN